MTSGWTGQHYDGIPAGTVNPVGTMQPRPALLGQLPPAPEMGRNYFLRSGLNGARDGSLDDLYDAPPLVPQGCHIAEPCAVPPMAFCADLHCPRGSTQVPGVGCVAPKGQLLQGYQ